MPPIFSELTEGRPVMPAVARPLPNLADYGYLESEWSMAGTASAFSPELNFSPALGTSVPDTPTLGDSGRLAEVAQESYCTRIVVRRPERARFSGVVLIEWLNVSSGQDAPPEYIFAAEEMVRRGHAWIGLSAQYISVEGGDSAIGGMLPTAPRGLKAIRPKRYAELHHPGDAFAYDILTQLGSWAHQPEPGGPLGELEPSVVLAIGESQSAFALSTYINHFQPRSPTFDGFLLHSRGPGELGMTAQGGPENLADAYLGAPVTLREDLPVPVMLVQAEGDLFDGVHWYPARQGDSERIAVWEVAGASHADKFQIGSFQEFLGCPDPVNSGQQAFVVRAALRALVDWAAGGSRPPAAEPLEVTTSEPGGPQLVFDEVGNARGGVRTPVVDAPVDVLTGSPRPDSPELCRLFGRTLEVDPQILRSIWPTKQAYLDAYRAAVDRLVAAGFLLADDVPEILEDARPHRITW